MKGKPKKVPKRRRREGKTNYHKRLKLLLAKKPRLVVRKSNTRIQAQMIKYSPEGDKVLLETNSKELEKYGWKHSLKNIPASYLTGVILAKKSLEKGIKEAVLDVGLTKATKGGKVFALQKGAIDAGLKIVHSEKIFPKERRIRGEHIKPEVVEQFEEIKTKILGQARPPTTKPKTKTKPKEGETKNG